MRPGVDTNPRDETVGFPPSPDGGFIEGRSTRRKCWGVTGVFPPSPDGGFIEGPEQPSGPHPGAAVSTISRWWLH